MWRFRTSQGTSIKRNQKTRKMGMFVNKEQLKILEMFVPEKKKAQRGLDMSLTNFQILPVGT